MGYRNIKKQKNIFFLSKLRILIFQCPGTTHITNFTRMPQWHRTWQSTHCAMEYGVWSKNLGNKDDLVAFLKKELNMDHGIHSTLQILFRFQQNILMQKLLKIPSCWPQRGFHIELACLRGYLVLYFRFGHPECFSWYLRNGDNDHLVGHSI